MHILLFKNNLKYLYDIFVYIRLSNFFPLKTYLWDGYYPKKCKNTLTVQIGEGLGFK